MFGRKKKKDEVEPAPPPPPVEEVSGPESPPQPDPSPPASAEPAVPAESADARKEIKVTPDYGSAQTLAANHIIVQAGNGKIVMDVASEMTEGEDGGKVLPVASRVVMTAQTGQRLVGALEQALRKLEHPPSSPGDP